MQAPSASLDVAASVSLPSSSISRSAATASYRYKDADKVDSDEAEQDDDGQKGYESSFFGSRDRNSRWTASQERANDNRSQARTSIPEISKDVCMIFSTFHYVLRLQLVYTFTISYSRTTLMAGCSSNTETIPWTKVKISGLERKKFL
jgi:hypothetical protein